MWVYLNDRFVPKEEAVVSVFDHGFLYGDGVFETLPVTRERLADLVRESLTRNQLQEAYLRITVSRGPGEIGLDPALCKSPTLVVIAKPFEPYPASFYTDGVSVIIAQTRRTPPEALPPHIKSLNFLNNVLAKMEAKAAGSHEALLLNHQGEVTEGTTSNVFVVQGQRLCTPAVECGLLAGITRGIVLQLAREAGIPAAETRLTASDLTGAEECFLTNTTQEVLPVTQVDGRRIGDGRPGEITRLLHASFRAGLDRFLDDL